MTNKVCRFLSSPLFVFFFSVVWFLVIAEVFIYRETDNRELIIAPLTELLHYFRNGDAGAYLLAGSSLGQGSISGDVRWIFNVWPPGMAHVYALITSLPIPTGIGILLFTSFLLSLNTALIFSLTKDLVSLQLAYYPSAFFLLNPFALMGLQPSHVFYSDYIGASFFLTLVLSWIGWLRNVQLGLFSPKANWFALGFALSSGFVISFRWALTPVVGMLWLFALLRLVGIRDTQNRSFPGRLWASIREFKRPLTVILVYAAPWTAVTSLVLHPPNPLWSSGNEYMWAQRWSLERNLPAWLVEGYGNWACLLDSLQCRNFEMRFPNNSMPWELARSQAILAIAKNPADFFEISVAKFFKGLFGAPFSPVGEYVSWPIAAISSGLLLAGIILCFLTRNFDMLFVYVSLTVSLFLILALNHVETRFFLPLHFMVFATAPYLMIVHLRGSLENV